MRQPFLFFFLKTPHPLIISDLSLHSLARRSLASGRGGVERLSEIIRRVGGGEKIECRVNIGKIQREGGSSALLALPCLTM